MTSSLRWGMAWPRGSRVGPLTRPPFSPRTRLSSSSMSWTCGSPRWARVAFPCVAAAGSARAARSSRSRSSAAGGRTRGGRGQEEGIPGGRGRRAAVLTHLPRPQAGGEYAARSGRPAAVPVAPQRSEAARSASRPGDAFLGWGGTQGRRRMRGGCWEAGA